MSWKNLKTFAIIVLIIMNIFFGIEVNRQYKRAHYYSESEIASVRALMSESGIYIEESYLRAKKVSLPAYKREYKDGATKEAVREVFGSAEADDGKYVAKTASGTYCFFGDGGFEYRREGETEMPRQVIDSSRARQIFILDEYTEKLEAAMKKAMPIEKINSLSQNRKAEKTDAKLYRLFVTDDGCYAAMFLQYIGGVQSSNAFYMLTDASGNIVSGEGNFSLLLPDEKLKADCADLLTVLFDEKRWADEYFSAQQQKDPAAKKIQLTLSMLYYSYDAYRSADGTEFYVPVINLVYSDGTVNSYNLTDGMKK